MIPFLHSAPVFRRRSLLSLAGILLPTALSLLSAAHGEAIVLLRTGGASLSAEAPVFDTETLMTLDGTELAGEAALSEDNRLEICLVRADSLSTDELIGELSALPQVLSAEPNRVIHIDGDGETIRQTDTVTPGYTADLSAGQWAFDGNANPYSADVPDWNDTDAPDNAVGIVAVLDTGIDYTHPDVVSAMWDGGLDYAPLVALGGGKYGFNAVSGADKSDPWDDHFHGTHCAGIIAADTDGDGVSGAARGVKLMAVKAFGADGTGRSDAIFRAFEYIRRAKECGVNIVAVNNSWSDPTSSAIYNLTVRTLGRLGIVCVFSAGNNARDCDVDYENGAYFKHNPYTVTVAATDRDGVLADFSNYGHSTTDVGAPGVDILSSVPERYAEQPVGDAGTPMNVSAVEENTRVYENDALYAESTSDGAPIALAVTPGVIPDGQTHAYIRLSAANAGETAEETMYLRVFLDLPYIPSDGGEPVTKRRKFDIKSDFTDIVLPLHTFITESNENGIRSYRSLFTDTESYPDIDRTVKLTLLFGTADTESRTFLPVKRQAIRIDALSLFTDNAVSAAAFNGTSMAAPVVTAEAAVLAAAFPFDTADRRAARIIGSTRPAAEENGDFCVSGGIVSFAAALRGDTCPVIDRVSVSEDGKTFTVSGFFFGSTVGRVALDGVYCAVTAWSDTDITAILPTDMTNGTKSIRVEAEDGHSGSQSLRVVRDGVLMPRLPAPMYGSTDKVGHFAACGNTLYLPVAVDGTPFSVELYGVSAGGRLFSCSSYIDTLGLSFADVAHTAVYGGCLLIPAGHTEGTFDTMLIYRADIGTWRTHAINSRSALRTAGGTLVGTRDALLYFLPDGAAYTVSADTYTTRSVSANPLNTKDGTTSIAGVCPLGGNTLLAVLRENGGLRVCRVTLKNYFGSPKLTVERKDGILPFSDGTDISFGAAPGGLFLFGFTRYTDGVPHDCFYYDAESGGITPFNGCVTADVPARHLTVGVLDGMLYAFIVSADETASGDNMPDGVGLACERFSTLDVTPGTKTGTFTLRTGGIFRKGRLIAALYRHEGETARLSAVREYDLSDGGEFSVDFAGADGDVVKVFFFDSATGRMCCAAKELPL